MASEDVLLDKLEEAGQVARSMLSTATANGEEEAVIDLYDGVCQHIAATILEYQVQQKALQ